MKEIIEDKLATKTDITSAKNEIENKFELIFIKTYLEIMMRFKALIFTLPS